MKAKNQKQPMDDIYYEPIKEDDPAEQVLEGIRRMARMEAAREVERIINAKGQIERKTVVCLDGRDIVVGGK